MKTNPSRFEWEFKFSLCRQYRIWNRSYWARDSKRNFFQKFALLWSAAYLHVERFTVCVRPLGKNCAIRLRTIRFFETFYLECIYFQFYILVIRFVLREQNIAEGTKYDGASRRALIEEEEEVNTSSITCGCSMQSQSQWKRTTKMIEFSNNEQNKLWLIIPT